MSNSLMELIKGVSAHLGDLGETFSILSKDCEAILERIQDDPQPLDYRSYVRSLFALIESILYSQKQLAKHVDTALKATTPVWADVAGLSQLELLAIDEKAFQIKDDGSVRAADSFIRFKQNFKLSFVVLAKCCGSDFRPTYDKNIGWDSLLKALSVRDRLMHPKSVKDLEVTPSEFRDAQRASDWFGKVFQVALESHKASFFMMLGALGKHEPFIASAKQTRETLPDLIKELEKLEGS
jgi:hypothetical protein